MSKRTIRVLLVEDNRGDIGIIHGALEEYRLANFEVEAVMSIKSCRQALEGSSFDILLLDYSLPGESGLEFLRSVEGKDGIPPVIMLTGQGDERVAKEAIRAGAYDYFPKDSIEPKTLGKAIRETLEQARLNEEERRRRDDHQRLAFRDPLTGLYNRRYLDDALEKECRRARRYWSSMSCLMMDLDGFKECNDRYGHLEGDALLKQVASVISASVRDIDTASRFGGDEFCVLLPETTLGGALQLAERLRFAVASLHLVAGKQAASITASIGVFSPEQRNHMRPDAILHHADLALADAKAAGKNQVRAYSTPSIGVA